jgi:cytochrome c oxidase cbb3-type subunit 4
MDVNDWRSLVTLLGLVSFLAIVAWAWSAKRRRDFDAAARLPFAESVPAGSATQESENAGGRRE